MRFCGRIVVNRYTSKYKSEQSEVKSGYFESPSIQGAQAKITRIANKLELFSWVQSWDDETRKYTGKDLRWRNWVKPVEMKDSESNPIMFTQKTSENEYGEQIYDDDTLSKYGRTVHYTVSLILYWYDHGKLDTLEHDLSLHSEHQGTE